jgi:thiamine pyrophosphokinase
MPRAVIFANGFMPYLDPVRALLRPDDVLLAADGGSHHLHALGLTPAVIIGDLDSLDPGFRSLINSGQIEVVLHPRDKDETDLELALDYAVQHDYRQILIIGALGGRLDQTLGNLALLTAPRLSILRHGEEQAFDVRLDDGLEEAFFMCNRSEVRGVAGDIVSLIPWGGEARGVSTDGLRWPLHAETLYPDKTRGISNELLGESASISIESGLLLVVHRRNLLS